MRLLSVLVLLLPLAVYLDVVKFYGPVLSVVAVLMLPLLLIWAWVRRGTVHALSRRTLLLSVVFLITCPVLTLFFANQQEQRLSEQVRQAAVPIAAYKAVKGQYPNSLKEVELLAAQHVLVSDSSLLVSGRVVTYLHRQKSATTMPEGDFAKLSYWSFGAYQRQLFDVGNGKFDSPLID